MEQQRLNVSQRMKSLMQYDKCAAATPRILVLHSNYWLDNACFNAATDMGWEIARAPVTMAGTMPREMIADLLQALTEFKPDFILSINLSGMDENGIFAHLFADLAIPYVTWFVDDPRTIIMDRNLYATEFAIALTWEKAYQDYLRQHGFSEVHVLPLAADHTLFNQPPTQNTTLPPTFVGNSMTDFASTEWKWLEKNPTLTQNIKDAFTKGNITREKFGQGLKAMLGQNACENLDPDEKRHAEMICFIEGTRALRRNLVITLQDEGLIVRGDNAWPAITRNCGTFLNYEIELPNYYNQCQLNLNTTSIQMSTAVNQRVFDCPAAGGFLLTDNQQTLCELFDIDNEIAAYNTPEECRERFRHYREHPKERKNISTRARTRILAEHTYKNRLNKIFDIVRQRYR